MAEPRVLVVYGTRAGQTARIAERIAERCRERGVYCSRFDVYDLPVDLPLDAYDGVVVGASAEHGLHQGRMARFLRQHREALAVRHTAFYSVSLAAAGNLLERHAAQKSAEGFVSRAGFHPELSEAMAGALRFSRADWLSRVFMRRFERHAGIDNPWDVDLELTDWHEVDQFTDHFLELLGVGAPDAREPGAAPNTPG